MIFEEFENDIIRIYGEGIDGEVFNYDNLNSFISNVVFNIDGGVTFSNLIGTYSNSKFFYIRMYVLKCGETFGKTYIIHINTKLDNHFKNSTHIQSNEFKDELDIKISKMKRNNIINNILDV